jgi:hypothetical protein
MFCGPFLVGLRSLRSLVPPYMTRPIGRSRLTSHASRLTPHVSILRPLPHRIKNPIPRITESGNDELAVVQLGVASADEDVGGGKLLMHRFNSPA